MFAPAAGPGASVVALRAVLIDDLGLERSSVVRTGKLDLNMNSIGSGVNANAVRSKSGWPGLAQSDISPDAAMLAGEDVVEALRDVPGLDRRAGDGAAAADFVDAEADVSFARGGFDRSGAGRAGLSRIGDVELEGEVVAAVAADLLAVDPHDRGGGDGVEAEPQAGVLGLEPTIGDPGRARQPRDAVVVSAQHPLPRPRDAHHQPRPLREPPALLEPLVARVRS